MGLGAFCSFRDAVRGRLGGSAYLPGFLSSQGSWRAPPRKSIEGKLRCVLMNARSTRSHDAKGSSPHNGYDEHGGVAAPQCTPVVNMHHAAPMIRILLVQYQMPVITMHAQFLIYIEEKKP